MSSCYNPALVSLHPHANEVLLMAYGADPGVAFTGEVQLARTDGVWRFTPPEGWTRDTELTLQETPILATTVVYNV